MPMISTSFSTERLSICPWHDQNGPLGSFAGLAEFVTHLLSQNVTASLPPSWQGSYSHARARSWISQLDTQATVLLLSERLRCEPVGIVILFAEKLSVAAPELRIGYLLSEQHWGQGFASELMVGFVAQCARDGIGVIRGGVAVDNYASRRVLERCGFALEEGPTDTAECTYRLDLQALS